jgi:hypothetical protein
MDIFIRTGGKLSYSEYVLLESTNYDLYNFGHGVYRFDNAKTPGEKFMKKQLEDQILRILRK